MVQSVRSSFNTLVKAACGLLGLVEIVFHLILFQIKSSIAVKHVQTHRKTREILMSRV